MSTNTNVEQKAASTREYKNISITVPIFDRGRTLNKTYDTESLYDILDQVPFMSISIPVYAYRNEYTDNDDNRGNFICGYVEAFNREAKTLDICIMEKFKDMIERYDEDVIIYPRVKVLGKNVISIIGLDFCERRYYSLINR